MAHTTYEDLIGLQEGMFSLRGRVAMVTGAAGWLGAPMAIGLAQAGAHVLLAGRSEGNLGELNRVMEVNGLSSEVIVLDVLEGSSITRIMDLVGSKHERLDVLINNAGPAASGPRGLDAHGASFQHASAAFVTATWNMTQSALPLLRKAVTKGGDASVINIASMYAKVAPDPRMYATTGEPENPPYYGAAKAGVLQLTRWLAANLGREKIRVNTLSPGPFPRFDKGPRSKEFIAAVQGRTFFGRTGRREEIAGAVVYLASSASTFMTGASIDLDGGWTNW